MITLGKAMLQTNKLEQRIEKIIGKKRVESFLNKRKGLGKSRGSKMAQYIIDKPASSLRRVKKINKAIDAAPYVGAAGAGAVGISFLKGKDEI
tara:strand:+ start:137 stop:415 length:279 start_codon:yes stop_codon:yes gene_type:complete